MESHPAQTTAHLSQGMPCRRGPTCPYLRRRRCASASLVRQDQPPDVSLLERIARLEHVVAQLEDRVDGVQTVPHVLVEYFDCVDAEDLVTYPPLTPSDQPGDQARRDPADPIQRPGGRSACGDTTTGPSESDLVEDCGSPAGAAACRVSADLLHRHGGCRSAGGVATTGLSDSDCAEDRESPQVQLGSVCANRSLTCECL